MNLDGLLVPNVTPFTAEGELDLPALERVVEFLVEGGVDGLIPCGTTGEFYALRDAERGDVLRTVMQAAGGRVRLLAGCNAAATRDVIAHGRLAAELGYEGIMLAPPYYSLPSTAELVAHFRAVAAAVPLPVLLYNYPARAGVAIDDEVLEGLADCEGIVGIKESSGDIGRLHAIMARFGDRYRICCGADDQALEYFAWGIDSWVAGAANVAPRQLKTLMQTAADGDLAAARAQMRRLLPYMQSMESGRYIPKAKLGMTLGGTDAGHVRGPLQPLSAAERTAFEVCWREATGG